MVLKSYQPSIRSLFIVMCSTFLLGSSVLGFMRLPQSFYYGTLIVLGIWTLLQCRNLKYNDKYILLFILISALSIIVNQPPGVFRAWTRLAGFIVVLMSVGPLLSSQKTILLRCQLFRGIMWFCVALSIGSFICYFLDINFFKKYGEILAIEAGWFSGLFSHSMLLGPFAGLSTIYVFAEYLGREKRPFWLLVISIICLASTFLSASRSAVGATLLGLLAVFINCFKGHMSRGLLFLTLIAAFLSITFPIWGDITDFLIEKQQNNLKAGGMFFSREAIWEVRFLEIRNHPITGVGFCCVDPNLSHVNKTTGIVEPGSSWLAIFSMTGIFGFLTFVLLFIKSFRNSLAIQNIKQSSLFVGCLAFFFLHLFFEGYVLAAGSMLGLVFWLLIGCVWSMNVD